jgi:small neutral amino acid transporter SnatA (MarC family)
LALAVLAAVLVVNAPRVRAALPDDDRLAVGALGAAVSLAALAVVAGLADPVADGLHLTASTIRMGVGAVLVLQGAAALLLSPPSAEPRLPGRAAALVPVAFPVLLTPGLGLLGLSMSLDRSAPVAVAVLAGALATVVVVAGLGSGRSGSVRPRMLRATGALLGAGLVLAGVALVIDGLFDL